MEDSPVSEEEQGGKESTLNKPPGFFAIAFSVVAAAFGVQTEANRQRDFSNTSPIPYIVGGLIFTLLFVLTLIGIVNLVLA